MNKYTWTYTVSCQNVFFLFIFFKNMSSLSQQNVYRSTWFELIGLEWSSYREFMSPSFKPLVLTKCWSVSVNLNVASVHETFVEDPFRNMDLTNCPYVGHETCISQSLYFCIFYNNLFLSLRIECYIQMSCYLYVYKFSLFMFIALYTNYFLWLSFENM